MDGLLSVKPRSGTFVTVLDMSEIEAVFQPRLALKSGAAEATWAIRAQQARNRKLPHARGKRKRAVQAQQGPDLDCGIGGGWGPADIALIAIAGLLPGLMIAWMGTDIQDGGERHTFG